MSTSTLTSNGSPIPFTPQYFGNLRETNASASADELRTAFKADGYVLLRGALSPDAVLNLREDYLSRFDAGTYQNGDARQGLFSGVIPVNLPVHGTKGHPAYEFVRDGAFRSFAAQPALRALAEIFLEGDAAPIRRTPLRHFYPGRKVASRAHLDRTYIDGVAADVVTMWVPLGDCPVRAGALVYLDGSHKDVDLERTIREHAPRDRPNDARPLTHDLKWISDATGKRWLTTDYKAGDIVIHSPAIVHASTDAEVDLIRVSTDIRFQRAGSPSDPRWDNDWSADDGY